MNSAPMSLTCDASAGPTNRPKTPSWSGACPIGIASRPRRRTPAGRQPAAQTRSTPDRHAQSPRLGSRGSAAGGQLRSFAAADGTPGHRAGLVQTGSPDAGGGCHPRRCRVRVVPQRGPCSPRGHGRDGPLVSSHALRSGGQPGESRRPCLHRRDVGADRNAGQRADGADCRLSSGQHRRRHRPGPPPLGEQGHQGPPLGRRGRRMGRRRGSRTRHCAGRAAHRRHHGAAAVRSIPGLQQQGRHGLASTMGRLTRRSAAGPGSDPRRADPPPAACGGHLRSRWEAGPAGCSPPRSTSSTCP
jgi:hypothetical protein